MKRPMPAFALVAITFFSLLMSGSPVLGQAAPGPEHAWLKRMEGDWTATLKGEGGEASGNMTFKMECNGLWLISDFRADFGGQPFHGRGMDGYDPGKKKFVSVWVDSMSPRPMVFEGERDPVQGVLTMVGEGPGLDGQPAKFKSVSRYPDDDHMTFTMYLVAADGTETRMMSVDYARKK